VRRAEHVELADDDLADVVAEAVRVLQCRDEQVDRPVGLLLVQRGERLPQRRRQLGVLLDRVLEAQSSRRSRACRPSAWKLPVTGSRVARAWSRSPSASSMRASGTAASARPGSSSSARCSESRSPSCTRASASEGISPEKNRSTAAGGCTPTNSSTTSPSRMAFTAGMPRMSKRRASSGFSSVSILASTTSPSCRAATASRIGLSDRHGPHQAAQKSTTTGVVRERSTTSVAKVCSVTSMTATELRIDHGRAASSDRPDAVSDPAIERLVQRPGVTLSAEESGAGRPIVLLHGLTATRRYVVMGAQSLQRSGHRVIAYDARGHGRSSPAPDPAAYGYDQLADDLEAVLDAFGESRALLAGASMGAQTAARLALRRPERVAALALITPAFDPGAPPSPAQLAVWDALATGLREGGADGFVAAYQTHRGVPERYRDTLLTVLRQRLSEHEHPDAVADALQAVPRSRPFEALSELERIAVPTVVVASRDEPDPEHPFAVGERYAEAIPGARLLVEEPGRSPLAWQGGQLSRVLAELAETAYTTDERT
jgi:pimeloyl-ACP methyl ester carboxylesterase